MPRKLLALLFLAAGLLGAAPAWASGDFTCSVAWKLKLTELSDCDNQPFLSPGNDSRVNLQLLLLDAGKARLHAPGPARTADQRYPDPVLAGPSPFTLQDIDDLIAPPPAPGSGDDSSDHADGEGSRCDSNMAGAEAFNVALAASPKLPAADRQALTDARAALRPSCADDPKAPPADAPPVSVKSALGKQFAAYLAGAQAFYDGRYDVAAQAFAGLQTSPQPWLKEVARYMLGRTALNRAQAASFDQYGELQPGKADAKALAEADTAFGAYLRDYPNGAYAASARGLLRRAAWLGGRTGDLARQFALAFADTDPGARNVDEVSLVQEADSKLLAGADPASLHEPMLLAVFDLLHMRTSDGADAVKPIDRAALEAQRPVFAGQPDLFSYLEAAHAFYDEKAPAAAVALLPATSPTAPMSYLGFSRQVLRGLALEETGDRAAAHALWLSLMPAARPPFQHAALELALAMNDERGGGLAQVFAAASPITDADLREILLRNAAGPALLRQQAKSATAPEHERRLALYTLLYKQVTRGRYQDFLGDLALLPPPPPPATGDNPTAPDPDFSPFRWDGKSDDGFVCPPLRQIAGALARDPRAPANLVCLSEFVRVSGVDGDRIDAAPPADELGGAPSQFTGGPYWRLDRYQALLADPKTQGTVRAYLLYRAVRCYASSGANHCGGKDVDKAQRKAWFETLKKDFAGSAWAQQLKYYW